MMLKIVFLQLLMIWCDAFLLLPVLTRRETITTPTSLAAKTSKKKKAKKKQSGNNGSGGGFGKVVEDIRTEPDDYSAFPRLEADVESTLVPSIDVLRDEAGVLPDEVYDRLEQIYGFPNFNHPMKDTQDDNDQPSLESLLTIEDSSSTKKPTSSMMSDNDFASLLASATGGSSSDPPPPSSSTGKSASRPERIQAIGRLPQFEDFRVLHMDPLVLAIDDFLSAEECDNYVSMTTSPKTDDDDSPFQTRSMTVGKDTNAKSQRTSTTWFHHYKRVPELIAKASRLLGIDRIDQWEEPQTVRYRRKEKFTWHLDALSPQESTAESGGQRLATLLVYLTDLEEDSGGSTRFRDLKGANDDMLKVRPKKGSALLFFPAAGGIPNAPFDIRTLHCGEAVDDSAPHDKWISQLWLREGSYTPSAPQGNQHALARDAITEYCRH